MAWPLHPSLILNAQEITQAIHNFSSKYQNPSNGFSHGTVYCSLESAQSRVKYI
jgi:hypothetical protein